MKLDDELHNAFIYWCQITPSAHFHSAFLKWLDKEYAITADHAIRNFINPPLYLYYKVKSTDEELLTLFLLRFG